MGGGAWRAAVHGVAEGRTRLSDFTFTFKSYFPDSSNGKESVCNAGDPSLIPGMGISAREGIGYPLQYSHPDSSMDKGVWWATVHGVANSQT